jgi:hypothetical protein
MMVAMTRFPFMVRMRRWGAAELGGLQLAERVYMDGRQLGLDRCGMRSWTDLMTRYGVDVKQRLELQVGNDGGG